MTSRHGPAWVPTKEPEDHWRLGYLGAELRVPHVTHSLVGFLFIELDQHIPALRPLQGLHKSIVKWLIFT